MGHGLWQERSRLVMSACLSRTASSRTRFGNRPHIPAGPSVPRSVPGWPPHLQVKRARHGCKGSSPCSLCSLQPPAAVFILTLLCGALSLPSLSPSGHTFDSCSFSPQTPHSTCLLIRLLLSIFHRLTPYPPCWPHVLLHSIPGPRVCSDVIGL